MRCRINQLKAAREDEGFQQGFDHPIAAMSTHTHTSELQNKQVQGCTRGARVTKVSPTKCCCEHTDVCCRINQFKVAPRDQRLHGFGRSTAAVRIHMCVSENIHSGLHLRVKGNKNLADQLQLHPRIKGYKGLADQVRLGAYTCVFRNLSIQSCTQVRHVWPTSRCCEHTHVCCRICQFKSAPNIPRL